MKNRLPQSVAVAMKNRLLRSAAVATKSLLPQSMALTMNGQWCRQERTRSFFGS